MCPMRLFHNLSGQFEMPLASDTRLNKHSNVIPKTQALRLKINEPAYHGSTTKKKQQLNYSVLKLLFGMNEVFRLSWNKFTMCFLGVRILALDMQIEGGQWVVGIHTLMPAYPMMIDLKCNGISQNRGLMQLALKTWQTHAYSY